MAERNFNYKKDCVLYYLRRIKELIDSIDNIESRLARTCARLDLLGVDYTGRDMPKGSGASHGDDEVAEGIFMLQQLREDLATSIAHCQNDIEQARAICSRNHIGKHAIWLHYVEGLLWRETAGEINCSRSGLYREIPDGIEALYSDMPIAYKVAYEKKTNS